MPAGWTTSSCVLGHIPHPGRGRPCSTAARCEPPLPAGIEETPTHRLLGPNRGHRAEGMFEHMSCRKGLDPRLHQWRSPGTNRAIWFDKVLQGKRAAILQPTGNGRGCAAKTAPFLAFSDQLRRENPSKLNDAALPARDSDTLSSPELLRTGQPEEAWFRAASSAILMYGQQLRCIWNSSIRDRGRKRCRNNAGPLWQVRSVGSSRVT